MVSIGGNDIKNQIVDVGIEQVVAFLPSLAQSIRTALLVSETMPLSHLPAC